MKKRILHIGLVLIVTLLIINPQKSVEYASEALSLCATIIIPTLFPFFVCSGLLIYSGFCQVLSNFLCPVMRPLFNVNGSGAAAFILGIISGYPQGALTTCQLYEKSYLSKTEAERLLAFTSNSGPLFIMGAVGIALYHSPKTGVILYVVHIISAIFTGVIFRFYKRKTYSADTMEITVEEKSFPEIFSVALQSSTQSILSVCASVIFFSVISSIAMDYIPVSGNLKAILKGVMEFVGGVTAISYTRMPIIYKLAISAGIVGFAGFSVHLQVMNIVSRYGLSLFPYFIGKTVQGVISVILAILLLRFVPSNVQTFSSLAKTMGGAFYINSLFVILSVLCVFFMGLSAVLYLWFSRKYNR